MTAILHDGLQRRVREAIVRADELSRRAHDERLEPLAGRLDALRTLLDGVDEAIGAKRARGGDWLDDVVETRGLLEEISSFSAIMAPGLRVALDDFLDSVRALPDAMDRFVAKMKSARFPVLPVIAAGLVLVGVGVAGAVILGEHQR